MPCPSILDPDINILAHEPESVLHGGVEVLQAGVGLRPSKSSTAYPCSADEGSFHAFIYLLYASAPPQSSGGKGPVRPSILGLTTSSFAFFKNPMS